MPDRLGVLFSTKQRSVVYMTVGEQAETWSARYPGRVQEVKLRTCITRFCEMPLDAHEYATPSESSGRSRHVLGVAPDGSVVDFSMLGLEAWRLARFIQNMWQRHLYPRSAAARQHIEPTVKGRTAAQLEGDLLTCLVDHPRAYELMKDMLDVPPTMTDDLYEDGPLDFATAARRRERFEELLNAVKYEGYCKITPLGSGGVGENVGKIDGNGRHGGSNGDAVETTRRSLATMTTDAAEARKGFASIPDEDEARGTSPYYTGDEAVRRALEYLSQLLVCPL